MNLPAIASLDLTYPPKYFGGLDSDPQEAMRRTARVNRRRVAAGLRTLTLARSPAEKVRVWKWRGDD